MELRPIGVIHSPYKSKDEAPFQGRWAKELKESVIEVFEEYKDAMQGLENIKHIIVLYWFDRADRDKLKTITPWGPEEKGVFSTRSPSRPNPIAFSIGEIRKIEENKIYVLGLDALDKSPLIDIKVYSYDIDAIKRPRKRIVFNSALWDECVSFHGHSCPGLAIGYRAAEAAVLKLKLTFSEDEEVVCITENNACGVDAIQYILGCTFGKGNLIFKDRGKQAFTFFRRDTGEGVRMVLKDLPRKENREEWTDELLRMNVEDIFDFQPPKDDIPKKAKIYPSLKCEICGERASERSMRIKDGKIVCIDCFEKD